MKNQVIFRVAKLMQNVNKVEIGRKYDLMTMRNPDMEALMDSAALADALTMWIIILEDANKK